MSYLAVELGPARSDAWSRPDAIEQSWNAGREPRRCGAHVLRSAVGQLIRPAGQRAPDVGTRDGAVMNHIDRCRRASRSFTLTNRLVR